MTVPVTTDLERETFLDIGYLIKYASLILSILGLVTSIIHSYFLSRILKTYPISICLLVISVCDTLLFFSRFIVETVTIVTYVDHKNCIGYVNRIDLMFKAVTEAAYYVSSTVEDWMVTVICMIQIVDLKKVSKQIWTLKLSIATSIATVGFNILSFIVQYTSIYFLLRELPYSECDKTNQAMMYLEGNHNWITSYFEGSEFVITGTYVFELILDTFLIFGMPCVIYKCKENGKKKNARLIYWLLMTSFLAWILRMVFSTVFLNSEVDWDFDDNEQQDSVVPTEVAKFLKVMAALFRPIIILAMSSEYQQTVKSFFIVEAFVPRASIVPSTSSYLND